MTQKSIQINDATQAQIDDLGKWGHGNFSSIVRTATDRMWYQEHQRREQAPAYERLEPGQYNAAWQMMDSEICDSLAGVADEMSMREYFAAYAAAHLEKFGKVWELAKVNPTW